jgi:molecular chaperone GrpE
VLVNARAQFVGRAAHVLDDVERAGSPRRPHGPVQVASADKLVSVVQKLGSSRSALEGEPFDPSVHEAVQHESATSPGPR